MQKGVSNPAPALRAAVEALGMPGMLRWDATGKALLVSDAPRHAGGDVWTGRLRGEGLRVQERDRLLWIDLPVSAYQALMAADFTERGGWHAAWFTEQALLGGILFRIRPCPDAEMQAKDEELLRGAMLACAKGERHVRSYLGVLRSADAAALRDERTGSSRASAALCAKWLWATHGIGLPEMKCVESDD